MTVRDWVAIGDSFTCGVGDDGPGWVAITAAHLIERGVLDTYRSHAEAGKTLDHVADEQLSRLTRHHIVSAIAGANDLLDLRREISEVIGAARDLIERVADVATILVTTTCPDFAGVRGRTSGRLHDRVRALNVAVLDAAGRHANVVVIDACAVMSDRSLWSTDRIHPNPAGHRALARAATLALQACASPTR
jgi:lysophospholipase L1-like esterase